MQIKTIEDLRDHALESLQRLEAGDIDTSEAGVIGKLCESVISTVKAQLEYARMLDKQPCIKFMNQAESPKNLIEHEPKQKRLK